MVLLIASQTHVVDAQTSSNGIDFSSELNRLDTVPADDNRAGSWGSDLEAWKRDNAKIAEEKKNDHLEKLKAKCKCYWNPSQCISSSLPFRLYSSDGCNASCKARKKCNHIS